MLFHFFNIDYSENQTLRKSVKDIENELENGRIKINDFLSEIHNKEQMANQFCKKEIQANENIKNLETQLKNYEE